MGLFGISSKAGIFESDLGHLLNGNATFSIASKLGFFESDLQLLLSSIGPKGAIGMVVQMLLKK